jgi:hypothetical protein
MKKIMHSALWLLFILILPVSSISQELPKTDPDHTFYMLPLFEGLREGVISFDEKNAQMLKMRDQLGQGNLYHRLGFSMIYSTSGTEFEDICYLLDKNNLQMGVIFDLQSHTREDYRSFAHQDLRFYQWRNNGHDWQGNPEDQRSFRVPTPSRYAAPLREFNKAKTVEWAQSVLKLMKEYPGLIAIVNGPIEEELAGGEFASTNDFSDYSPFAITEFRDWLRHTGIYDDSSGEYAGEGAPENIIGEFIDFNGVMRSPFYDDPNPYENNGTGESFNRFFGTAFTTWTLRFWDLLMYPDPITDESFDPTPEEGEGYVAGGFDAPREMQPNNKFWNAWSYEVTAHDDEYPEGNPGNPAFGFRQHLVRNYIRDLFDILIEEGIPVKTMFAHQIPVEIIMSELRELSSASPIWTGYMDKLQTVGITRFGNLDPSLVTQYADRWGIFEWHTSPETDPDSQKLYDISINALNLYYENKCQALMPGWWETTPPDENTTFPLNDSKFADAIHNFMQSTKEQPYNEQGSEIPDYIPSKVLDVSATTDDTQLMIKWSDKIWDDLPTRWKEWSKFSRFEIEWSKDGTTWDHSDTTSSFSLSVPTTENGYFVRVRAISSTGKQGAWSDVAESVIIDPNATGWQFIADYDTINASPDLTNLIVVKNIDEPIDTTALQVKIKGHGQLINTLPENYQNIEKLWRFNYTNEMFSINHLVGLKAKGGVVSAKVTGDEPSDPYFFLSGSNVDGNSLKHISLRMYSSVSSLGNLFWWTADGGFYSTEFPVSKGWQIIHLDNLPNWQGAIDKVRIDPGSTPHAFIMIDWAAISSQNISDNLTDELIFPQRRKIELLTSPDSTEGNYIITVSYKGKSDSISIYSNLQNEIPYISLCSPTGDTTIEKGTKLKLKTQASDKDGIIDHVVFYADGSPFYQSYTEPFCFESVVNIPGVFQVEAEAFDNLGAAQKSNSITVSVVEQLPYQEVHQVPGVVEAENYDLGGQNIAYFDTDPVNEGGVYRNDGVDIGKHSNNYDGYYIGWIKNGEWLEYTIESKVNMKAEITVWVASNSDTGELHLEIDNRIATPHQFVMNTGGMDVYKRLKIFDVPVRKGKQKLKLYFDKGGFNINKFEIRRYKSKFTKPVSEYCLRLYPNPANDEIKFTYKEAASCKMEIFNIMGQKMEDKMLDTKYTQVVNISSLAPGVYIMRVTFEDCNVLQNRFVKY